MASEERLRELEEKYEGFTVYDNQGSKIGKVDDLFVDEKDNEEYIGVKMGFLGRKSTLIPTEIVRVNESERTIEVSESKDHVKEAPSFDDDEDVTAAYEDRIRRHFGLESLRESSGRGSYGAGSGSASGAASGAAAGGASSDHDEGHEGGTSGYATGEDRGTSSGGAHDADEPSSGTETRPGETEGSGTTVSGERGGYEGSGTSETTGASSGSRPTTSKQTEETETFEEGGRTKIRRRIIREEVVDADDQN